MKNYDVVIVGAGPVGLTFANFMAQFGHTVCVLEKEKNLFPTPRAVAVDDESLRIWQQIGLLQDMLQYIESGDEGDEVLTYHDYNGKKLMSIFQHSKPYGYSKGSVILQHEIEKILLNGLKRFQKNVDVFFEHEFQNFTQTKTDVKVCANNNNKSVYYGCKYLVACDGGKSAIRKQMGIKMKGFTYPQSWLIVDTIEDRNERIGAEVICDPTQPIATIPLPKNHRRFEFFLKEKREANSFSEIDVQKILGKQKKFKIKKILRHLVYTFNARIAEKYSHGRVFLVGDACHVTPPFAGQGLATGLRDSANLSWKISECIKGCFSNELLESYEQERRPHQERMINLAVNLGKFMTPKTRFSAFIMGSVMKMISKIKILRNWFEIRGQNIQPFYKSGFIKSGNMAGRYFPQPSFTYNKQTKMFDELLGEKFTVVSFGCNADEFLSKQEIEYWKKIDADFLNVPSEKSNIFSNFINLSKKHVFIIRPDKIIYLHCQK